MMRSNCGIDMDDAFKLWDWHVLWMGLTWIIASNYSGQDRGVLSYHFWLFSSSFFLRFLFENRNADVFCAQYLQIAEMATAAIDAHISQWHGID